jgi:hypothetical protein
MSRWTDLRKIADSQTWYTDCFDHGSPQVVYVGETGNESARLSCCARNGSHLSELINLHLAHGWSLYYRAQALDSKEAAKKMQDSRLARFFYPWNQRGV